MTAVGTPTAAAPVQQRTLRRRLVERADRVRLFVEPSRLRRWYLEVERRIGVTRIGIAAVFAAVAMWALAYVVAGTAMYLFAYGIVLLLGLSFVIAPRNLKLEGDRSGLFPRVTAGDRLDVRVALRAKRSVSTFLLEERVPERLGSTVKVPVTRLPKGRSVEHQYTLRAARRGVYQVGPLVAVASDPLGLSERETVVAESFELLVHPRIELVSDRPLTRSFEDPPIRPPVSRPWPSGMEFYGMREYRPGDDVRKIVWKATARTGRVMIQEAEQGITDHITIILDTDRTHHSNDGDGLSESFEIGVRAAASLAVRHLREGYEVRIEANAKALTQHLRGTTNQTLLLDQFARVELDREPLPSVITRMLASGQRDAHNVLVTPHLSPQTVGQLKLLLQTGVSVMVVALLWDEDDSQIMGAAGALGCQVVGVKPGDDLATALFHDAASGGRV